MSNFNNIPFGMQQNPNNPAPPARYLFQPQQQLVPPLQFSPLGVNLQPNPIPHQGSTPTAVTPRRKGYITSRALSLLREIPGITEDSVFHALAFADVLKPDDTSYNYIREYVRNSQVHNFGMKVLSIIALTHFDELVFDCDLNIQSKKRMLLSQGVTANSLAAILYDGLKPIAGEGIQFADRCSKSAKSCESTQSGTIGYLIFCEVALGLQYNDQSIPLNCTTAPSIKKRNGQVIPCDSVMCAGKWMPDDEENICLENKCIIPSGKSVQDPRSKNSTFNHNHFVVYNEKSVKMKYLVKIEFKPRVYEY